MDKEDIIKALFNCITLKINDECLSHILVLYEKQIREKAIDEFVNWAYIQGVSFSFMGKIKEDGTSDVVDRLNAIKSDFYTQKKEEEND